MEAPCKITKMNKAELEHYLHQRWGDRIGPVKSKAEVQKKTGMIYEYEANKPHRTVATMKDGRRRIREVDGSISYEYAEGNL